MNREAWRVTVHRVAKSQTQLKRLNTHSHTHTRHFYPFFSYSQVMICPLPARKTQIWTQAAHTQYSQ